MILEHVWDVNADPFTNTVDVRVNGVPPNPGQVIIQVMGLNLWRFGGTNYLLEFSGAAGQGYQIQTSTDLLRWLNWTNVQGPAWTAPLPDPSQTHYPWQFFRATYQ